jgi:hypothetical protein
MADDLPGIAREIEAVIGTELTLRLLEKRGGSEIKVPTKARGTKLAEWVGEDAAQKIVDVIGPGKLELPCGDLRGAKGRRRRGIAMLERGATLEEVAFECDVHVRTATNWRHEMGGRRPLPTPGKQLRLPL